MYGQLIGGLLGGYLAKKNTPKYVQPDVKKISAAELNAASIPQMQRSADNRIGAMAARRSAEGGKTAGEIYEGTAIRQGLQGEIANRRALNELAATQQNNQIAMQQAQAQNAAKNQAWYNMQQGALIGANMGKGFNAEKKEDTSGFNTNNVFDTSAAQGGYTPGSYQLPSTSLSANQNYNHFPEMKPLGYGNLLKGQVK